MKHLITALLLFIFLSLVGYSIYQATQFNTASDDAKHVTTHDHPINNQNISNVTVSDLKSNKLILRDELKHDINIINFWASWCGPCNDEMPELVAFDSEKPNHVGLIGMNVSDKKKKRDAFIMHYKAKYPMLVLDETQMKQYKINNIPTTIFVDRKGKVLKTYIGELNRNKLEKIIANLK